MPPELLAILTQVPLVTAFIWYSDRLSNKFLEFLRQEREARDIASKEQAAAINELTAAIMLLLERNRTGKRMDKKVP